MKNSILYFYTIILGLGFALAGCNHETDIFDGPDLIDRFGEFKVNSGLMVSQPTVDFAGGESVYFTAAFNKNIDWIIEITGMESGAVKRIEGFDKDITVDNSIWNGGTTDLPFFRAEMCSVKLTVPEEPEFMEEAEVEVLSAKIYEGSIFTDFETDQGSLIEFGNYEFELTNESGRRNNIPAAQGEYYYLLEGTDDVVSNFFVGLINVSAGVTGETYVPLPTKDPENLYFNCFLYTEGAPHTIAVIQFVYDTNDNGVFNDGVDETFQVTGDFPLTGKAPGWHQISHSMADVGITQEQLDKLVTIRVLLISDMNSQPDPPLQVSYGIDYMTFTQGGPLEL
jgi:hypothetical protein